MKLKKKVHSINDFFEKRNMKRSASFYESPEKKAFYKFQSEQALQIKK